MNVAIIVSTTDLAGMNIKENLISSFEKTNEEFNNHPVYQADINNNLTKLFTTDIESINCENIDQQITTTNFKPDIIIFATKHQSASKIPSLSVHIQGNWNTAELGGKDHKLPKAPARVLRFALELLQKNRLEGYDIIQECTHHGPYLETESLFIEIGSEEKAWQNKDAGTTLAKTIIELITNINKIPNYSPAIGIGGPHHTPAFTKVMARTDLAFGHICPKYMVDKLTKELIIQAINQTVPKAEIIILDWKGLGTEKQRIISILDELNIKYEKSHSIGK